ncbi:hypothetical protein BDV06DRAFT_217756 [Aspergillus oleicola]
MDLLLIFQLTASAAASVSSGANLILWLLSIGGLNWRTFDKKLLIVSQAVIWGLLLLAQSSFIYVRLDLIRFPGLFGVILQVETGCLLLLLITNEYLSISALQSRLIHILAVLSFVGTLVILLLSTYSPEQRNIFRLSFMITSLASLSFVHVQHIHTSAFKLFWRCPCHTAPKHEQALWIASVGSIGLFLLLLGSTILACTQPYLWTQLATFEVAVISIRKVAISIYLLRVPECNMVTVEV